MHLERTVSNLDPIFLFSDRPELSASRNRVLHPSFLELIVLGAGAAIIFQVLLG